MSAPNDSHQSDAYFEEKRWDAPVRLAGAHLCHFHLCENDRGIPGTGLVHWDELFGALAALGYQGYAGMESFFNVSDDMRPGTPVWRDVAPSGDALVSEGARFLRDMAERHGLRATPATMGS